MNAKTVFACTHIEKIATEDDFETGCSLEYTCVMSESVNYTADTLEALVKKVCDVYGLDFPDYISLDDCDGKDRIPSVSFNRTETQDGFAPSERELEKWKEGKQKLWLADYTLWVEKRAVGFITVSDLEGLPCDV